MNTTEKIGADLHGEDAEARRAAAAMMGKARTPAKVEAARRNAQKAAEARAGQGTSPAQKAAVKARWDAYRAQKAAEPTAPAASVRKRGRPRKETTTAQEIPQAVPVQD